MLDYKLLHALVMVVQECGFDRAARSLHLTQSAVSQRIRQLEEQTGQILLARTTPPRPTMAGKRLIKHCHQVMLMEAELDDLEGLSGSGEVRSISIGINADSLATWFLTAVTPLLEIERIVLDIHVDDQDETHRLLRDGDVAGCISTRATSVQGCQAIPLGVMTYRLCASPSFASRHFPCGVTREAVSTAPVLLFNRKDRLSHRFMKTFLGMINDSFPRHYLPSSEKFVDFIAAGFAYGMLPDLQTSTLRKKGHLVDLCPDIAVPVSLYWHCWGVAATPLKKLTAALSRGASQLLAPPDSQAAASIKVG
jgi:LysR family transcriptional regulator (chromosome initiation inhibitor)